MYLLVRLDIGELGRPPADGPARVVSSLSVAAVFVQNIAQRREIKVPPEAALNSGELVQQLVWVAGVVVVEDD